MGIEFRLGRLDHRAVEDFLASEPPHVDGIWVEAGNVSRQATVIEQARVVGVDVLIEPLTERLAEEGFFPHVPYAQDGPLDLPRLARSTAHRGRLIDAVLGTQSVATVLTPPHFYVTDAESAVLNVALAAGAIEAAGADVRAILLAKRDYLARPGVAQDLAQQYADVGVVALDLRLTPLGTNDDGPRKIRSCYDIVTAFRNEGIAVTLGSQGLIGQTGLALGVVRGFSVGVGMRESLDHTATMTAQRTPRDEDAPFFATQPAIWLPGAEIGVPRRVATFLLNDVAIRSRLACRLGPCTADITAPLSNARTHYLHSRAAEVAALMARPTPWRPSQEETRLRRAIEMRSIINDRLPATINESPVHPLKTRTLEVLVAELEWRQQRAA